MRTPELKLSIPSFYLGGHILSDKTLAVNTMGPPPFDIPKSPLDKLRFIG